MHQKHDAANAATTPQRVPAGDPRPLPDAVLPTLDARGVGRPASNRRPLEHQMPKTWFLRTSGFRWYAIRELSGLVVGLFTIHLVGAVIAVNAGPAAWETWLSIQRHPVVMILTVIVAIMTAVAAVTWYAVTPKIVRIRTGRKFLGNRWIIGAHYAIATLVILAMIWWLGGSR